MSFLDDIRYENRVFYTECDYSKLQESGDRLAALVDRKVLDDGNTKDATALRLRIGVKRILVYLIQKNLSIHSVGDMVTELELIATEAETAGFGKTAELAIRGRDFTVRVAELYAAFSKARRAYLSPDGKYAPIDESSCVNAMNEYRALRDTVA